MPSKVFGPTDSVADTLTQIGSTYQMPPDGPWIVYRVIVGKGNVVNAKECAGHVHIETAKARYDFAYGNGTGGATNTQNVPAEQIDCAIPVASNSSIKIYALDATAAKDVTVSVQFSKSNEAIIASKRPNPSTFRTLAAGGISANGDTVADTEESFTVSAKLTGASLQPEQNGRIYQIRYAGSGIIDAKANSAKITVIVPGEAGPYEYAVGCGPGGATLGTESPADVIDIPEGIPVKSEGTITVNITSAEAIKTPVISLSYW